MKDTSKSQKAAVAPTPPIGVLARGLIILECFSEEHLHLQLRELAQMTGLDKATLLRLLNTFIEYGYVQRSLDGKYAPGHNLLRLGALYRSTFDLGQRLQPILRTIMLETHESVAFYIREGDMRVCLYRENVSRDVRYVFEVGTRVALGDGGSASHVLRAFTDGSSPRTEEVLKNGYAITRAERSPELASISVPVSEPHGRLLGAIQITSILNRQTEAQQIAAAEVAIRTLAENGFDSRPTRITGSATL
ncbi:MAG: IclR family transcriptional regulator [Advenella sp.]